MKYIAKMMLALLASVTLVIPAYAWDFSASGSMSAKWEQSTTKASANADAITSANFSSASGGVSLMSNHTDGDKTLALKYSADVDTDGTAGDAGLGVDRGLDQTLSLAGSVKVGKWTASATASQSLMEDGRHEAAKIENDDDGAITLTDGSITYKLGDAAHLSTAEKVADTTADGASEADAEARVDSFNGFSVGLPVGPGSLTVALDMNSGTSYSALGEGEAGLDSAAGCGGQMTGFGFNFAGNVGADLSVTYGSGSWAASKTGCTGDNASNSASSSTLGLGVAVPVGAMTIGLDFESSSYAGKGAGADLKGTKGGTQVSVAIGGIADGTVTAAFATNSSTTGDEDAIVRTGMEVGWKTTVGAAGLEVAYGSWSDNEAGGEDSASDIEIEMSLSF